MGWQQTRDGESKAHSKMNILLYYEIQIKTWQELVILISRDTLSRRLLALSYTDQTRLCSNTYTQHNHPSPFGTSGEDPSACIIHTTNLMLYRRNNIISACGPNIINLRSRWCWKSSYIDIIRGLHHTKQLLHIQLSLRPTFLGKQMAS